MNFLRAEHTIIACRETYIQGFDRFSNLVVFPFLSFLVSVSISHGCSIPVFVDRTPCLKCKLRVVSVPGKTIRSLKTNGQTYFAILLFRTNKFDAGSQQSTKLPPGGLVEQAHWNLLLKKDEAQNVKKKYVKHVDIRRD